MESPVIATEKTTKALYFVAFIVFIDLCGLGLIIPVMPSLIAGLTGAAIDRAAEIGGLLLFAYAMMQFLFAPIIGGLSDRFGRRPVLLITLAALGVDYILMAIAPTLLWLFIGRTVSGIMGATFAAANSCIADMVDQKDRGRAYGLLGAAGAAGLILGPSIGGILGQWGDRAPFWTAAGLCICGAATGYLLLPETLTKAKRRMFDMKRANPLGNIVQMSKSPVVFGFLGVIFLMELGAQVQIAIWPYYNILKFGWSPFTIGISVALFGLLVMISQGVLTGKSIARFGEVKTGSIALIAIIPTYLIFAFANAGWMMFAAMIIAVPANMAFPAMQAMMTRITAEDAQGELQGAIASMISITSIIGPILMSAVFGAYADDQGLYFPGAPFLLATILMALAFILYRRTARKV